MAPLLETLKRSCINDLGTLAAFLHLNTTSSHLSRQGAFISSSNNRWICVTHVFRYIFQLTEYILRFRRRLCIYPNGSWHLTRHFPTTLESGQPHSLNNSTNIQPQVPSCNVPFLTSDYDHCSRNVRTSPRQSLRCAKETKAQPYIRPSQGRD